MWLCQHSDGGAAHKSAAGFVCIQSGTRWWPRGFKSGLLFYDVHHFSPFMSLSSLFCRLPSCKNPVFTEKSSGWGVSWGPQLIFAPRPPNRFIWPWSVHFSSLLLPLFSHCCLVLVSQFFTSLSSSPPPHSPFYPSLFLPLPSSSLFSFLVFSPVVICSSPSSCLPQLFFFFSLITSLFFSLV